MNKEKAIEMLKALNMMLRNEPISDVCDALDMAIEALSESKRGKWKTVIRHEHYPSGKEYEADYCSVCGRRGSLEYNYCPCCGARMESE